MNTPPKRRKRGTPKLADFLCFAVYSANLTFSKAYKPLLEKLGLTYTQYIIVIALWEEDHQTVTSLGDKVFLESNTLTPILKKLQSLGYVQRERDTVDERQVFVSLTEAGRRLRANALGSSLANACGLTETEFGEARELLIRVRGNLRRASET